ncbi:MAG: tRNA (guanosine(37)-N1)-methyltransferase TrmD [Erysipelotrichaceae bacterium]|nr:tRNA (guanosine(37)-N1)-methyltransferase TrmD [Erysipelotrichaceae bacterium]
MKIKILTIFPEMFDGFLNCSIIKRATDAGKVEIECINFREYTKDKHNKVDDTPYGGGQGMILACQPLADAIQANKTERTKVILVTPEGTTFRQPIAHKLAMEDELMFVCGHYEGFDARIKNYIDMELSLGDFVLTGGETAAMVFTDAVVRLLDGVIRKDSYEDESFEQGLLEYPQYTKPAVYDGYEVPEILLSGHHENIRIWRLKESLRQTLQKRPDLLEKKQLTKEEQKLLDEIKRDCH